MQLAYERSVNVAAGRQERCRVACCGEVVGDGGDHQSKLERNASASTRSLRPGGTAERRKSSTQGNARNASGITPHSGCSLSFDFCDIALNQTVQNIELNTDLDKDSNLDNESSFQDASHKSAEFWERLGSRQFRSRTRNRLRQLLEADW